MLKIQSDRVIIDGHEPTKEQCEIMTLLANALAESESFKTVRYESGYAEFEKVGKADELKFPLRNDISVYFDENIISVTAFGNTVTTSGDVILGGTNSGEYTVVLKDGYVIDSVTATDGISISNITDTTFYGEWVDNAYADITITSKQATSTPRKSIDLTTLPGWSSLSSGSHSITIVAKADGYRDSEPSAAVSVTKAAEEYTDCITFTGESSDFTLAVGSAGAKEWDGTVEYSTDHNTWTTWNGAAVSSVDKKLYLRGSGNTKFYTSKGARLSLSAKAACSGNIQTLLEYSNPPTSIPASYCYSYMFRDCTNLITAPDLPATTLTNYCYQYMFRNCTSLIAAPELPATTLTGYCYYYMFYGCTSLTQAPELPATTLVTSCYRAMFQNCTSLKISATQSSEYPTAWRIPSSGTISSTPSNWNFEMLSGTGGTFKSNPSINTTYYGAWTSATPTLISFTIAGTSYQAEEGMTWAEWVESSYNTDGYYVSGGSVFTPEKYLISSVLQSSTIIDGNNYSINAGGSGGGSPK